MELRFHTGDHPSHIAEGQEDRFVRCSYAVSNCLIVNILTQGKRFQTKPKRSKIEDEIYEDEIDLTLRWKLLQGSLQN